MRDEFRFYMPEDKINKENRYGSRFIIDNEKFYKCDLEQFDINYGMITHCNINDITDDLEGFAKFLCGEIICYKGDFLNLEINKTNKTKIKPNTLSNKIKLERGNKCELCGYAECNCDVHHIRPKSKGGTNDKSNLIVVCPNCHRKEHEKLRRKK